MKLSLLPLLVLVLAACAPSHLSQVALDGDLPELREAIESARDDGKLDRKAVRELAQAVAVREITAASGDEGVARVRDLRACAAVLDRALSDRADQEDAVAAAATLALLDAGEADPDDTFEDYIDSPDPNWRAVGARSAVGEDRTQERQHAFVDGDLRVRRGAFHAALQAPVRADLAGALEAARLDPDPLVRSLGVRLAGKIGGSSAVRRLRDLWVRAESETRQVIVDAWADPNSLEVGGREQLLWAMETEKGLPSIVAAVRLSAKGSPHRLQALGRLASAMDVGPVDEQRLAALMAPQELDLVEPLRKLAKSEDPHAAVLAAAALARNPKTAEQARTRLRELATHRRVLISRQARAALVVMGDQSLTPKLVAELESGSPERRRQAAVDLVRVGAFAQAAPILADPVARVRTQLACTVLRQP
jgi:hypothetical protein